MNGRLVTIEELSSDQLVQMRTLMQAHYANVHCETFQKDLESKSHVLLLEVDRQIVGFSSLVVYDAQGPSADTIKVVYSGDTVVDRAHWGSPALFTNWMKALSELGAYGEGISSFWLLLSSGARTYRMLTAFWKTYFPQVGSDNSEFAALANRLAAERFGDRFDPKTGIVWLANAYAVRPEIMPNGKSEVNPHVRYFHERNPGHVVGDELVCVTELSPRNLTRLGARMVASS